MRSATYVRPVAYHRDHPHRLLLNDEEGRWYTWMGDDTGLEELEPGLAQWMYRCPEIAPVTGPGMWFDIDSLPVCTETHAG